MGAGRALQHAQMALSSMPFAQCVQGCHVPRVFHGNIERVGGCVLRLPADGSKHQGHDPPIGANDIEGEVGGILFLGHLHHCARAPWHDIMSFVMKVLSANITCMAARCIHACWGCVMFYISFTLCVWSTPAVGLDGACHWHMRARLRIWLTVVSSRQHPRPSESKRLPGTR